MNNFTIIKVENKDVIIDISKLFVKECIYINITVLAKQFGKSRQAVNRFFKSKTYGDYESELFNVNKSDDIKNQNTYYKYSIEGRYGGTYLHNDILVIFLRWLSPAFAVRCDKYIKSEIQRVHNEKLIAKTTVEANKKNEEWTNERKISKTVRITLQDKIKEFCNYTEEQRGSKYKTCPFYKLITEAIYNYLELQIPSKNVKPRDYYSGSEIEAIKNAEKHVIKLLDNIIKNNKPRSGIKEQIFKYLTQYEVGNKL